MTVERDARIAAEGLDRPTASLLVRCWMEPRQDSTDEPVVRAYVRNLKTGEESFVGDVETVAQLILEQLRPGEGGEQGAVVSTNRDGRTTLHG